MIRRNRHEQEFNHDAWSFLPERFVTVYSELCRRALAAPQSGLRGQERVSGRSGAPSPLQDDSALETKRAIDKALRKIAREAETGRKQPRPKCAGCGKFVQPEWKFCSQCGRGLTGSADTITAPERRAAWKGLDLR